MKKELDYLTTYLNNHYEQMMDEFDLLQKIHLMNDKNFSHLQNKPVNWDRKLCNRFPFYKKIRRELDLNFRCISFRFKEKEIKLARRDGRKRWEDLYVSSLHNQQKHQFLKNPLIKLMILICLGLKIFFKIQIKQTSQKLMNY